MEPLVRWGINGQQSADNGFSFWACIRVKDSRYTQNTCSQVFQKSPPNLFTHEQRSIHKLCKEMGDDPDEVLSALRIWPEVVMHGGRLFSINNRRAYCIKQCDAPELSRISVELYLSPHDYDRNYGPGSFKKYYETTCEGEYITLTPPHYKSSLARSLGHQHVAEAHVNLTTAGNVKQICADDRFRHAYNLLGVLDMGGNEVSIRGALQHDVALTAGFLPGRHGAQTDCAAEPASTHQADADSCWCCYSLYGQLCHFKRHGL
jgi:hypothetical protein